MKKTYLTVLIASIFCTASYNALADCGEDEEIFSCPHDDNSSENTTSLYLCANQQGAYYLEKFKRGNEEREVRYPELGQAGQFFVSEYRDEDGNTQYRVRFKHQSKEYVIYNEHSPPDEDDEDTMFPYGGFSNGVIEIKDRKPLEWTTCGKPSGVDGQLMNSLAEQEPFNHQLLSSER